MKLNKTVEMESRNDATVNEEGALAFKLSPKERLYQRVLTTLFGEKKFYGKQDIEIVADLKSVAKEDPEFILKLASYARNEMYLRTVPQVLAVEAANLPELKGKGLINKYVPLITQRADEMAEMLAYQLNVYGKPIPNALIRGLKKSFHKFDEYQFAKYRKGVVNLKDALRIVHPKPRNDEEVALYKRILNDDLKTPETWEVVISDKGSTKEAWESVIPKMGYMALLRNLRNFLKVDVDLTPVIAKLTNKEEVAKSKQFPFRFLSAYKELEQVTGSSKILNAIQDAMELSINNLPVFKGTTFMSADNSGSMHSPLSERGSVQYADVANLLQAIAHKLCENGLTSVFGRDFQMVSVSSRSSILDNTDKFKNTDVGHSTNGYKAIKHLIDNNIKVDRIMIFSDEQLYESSHGWGETNTTIADLLKVYKKSINPNVYLYLFDLCGYGTTVFPTSEPRVVLIAGWSEKVLNFVDKFEKDKKDMLSEIDKYGVK